MLNNASPRSFVALVALAIASLSLSLAQASGPRVLPEGKLPGDARLGELKTLKGYFPMTVPASKEAWERRSAQLRRQLLVALGLWPMPEKTPANAVIHGLIDRGDYTVEKVYFESFPGHFVTGNLYRPKGKTGRLPAMLNPHGHFADGRFYDAGPKQIKNDLVNGAERFAEGGRSPLQSRCVQQARMGCVVFHYDMVGYADSVQIEHRPGVRRSMSSPDAWGFFSPQAELRLQNMMGLQAYNSIRAFDFLSELPDVDPERIGVTGESGGGTQTFILCALDPRPKVAFPAVMVSTAMQGGCTCENCCYLRVGTGNIDFAGLFAPKPLGMTGADDWTKEIATKGLPELKQLYKLYGVEDLVMARPLLQFGHNYNYVSRAIMYSWINKHLGLGLPEPIVEEDYQRLSIAEASVWDNDHPRPPSGNDYERSLLKQLTAEAERQIAAVTPKDAESLKQHRELVGGGWSVLVGRELPEPGAVTWVNIQENDRQSYIEFAGLLRDASRGAELPTVFLLPKQWNKRSVIWATGAGKAGLYDTSGGLRPEVKKLVDAGTAVGAADLLYQGEFLPDGKPLEKQRTVGDALVGYAGYTYGYNHPLFSQRAQDLLSLVSFARNYEDKPERVDLVGIEGAGLWAAAAKAVAGDAIDRLAVDTAGFRFASLTALDDPEFLPGAVKYGDVPGLLSLCATGKTWIAGEGDALPELVKSAASAAGNGAGASSFAGDKAGAAAAAVDWLLE